MCIPQCARQIGMQSKVDPGMTKWLLLSPFSMHHMVVRFYDYIPRILTCATWTAERKQWKVVWKSWMLIQQRWGVQLAFLVSCKDLAYYAQGFSPLSPPHLRDILRCVPTLNWIPVSERGRERGGERERERERRARMSCNNIFSVTKEISQLCVKSRNSCAVMPYSKDPEFL